MRGLNLRSMSFDDLIALRDDVARLISRKAKSARKELETKLALLEGLGGRVGGRRKTRGSALKGRKVAPKYRNPKNRSETWAGRGATPRWLRAYLKAGKKLEDFQIKRGRPKKA
jgi:DNA-binding protein H-NS